MLATQYRLTTPLHTSRSLGPSRQLCSPPGGWGWAPSKFYETLVLPRPMYGAAESPQPKGPSITELLATTGQTSMADLLRRHRFRWLGRAR